MPQVLAAGNVRKMRTRLDRPVQYAMLLGEAEVPLNPYLGQSLQLSFQGQINCIHCGRKTSKSFNQGYCYPCFKRLAQCDSCIVSPEKCHYAAGTCREPEWGEAHCMIEHVVYLPNTSGLKVGITRGSQVPTRWMDQGHSGLVETLFKHHIADRTNWQAMLKGAAEPRDLEADRQRLVAECAADIQGVREQFGLQSITELAGAAETRIDYPVLEYPARVSSFNLDKTPTVGGTLTGIKGQYLMFDTGVINMRKYGGYHLTLTLH